METLKGWSPVQSDDAISLRRIAGGDPGAMRAFYEHHATQLYRFALARLGDAQEAEDVVQETMLAVWRGAAAYRGEARPRTWLFGICRNKVAERLKGRRATPRPLRWGEGGSVAVGGAPSGLPLGAVSGTAPAAAGEEALEFREAFAHLSGEHRELLLLVFHYGFTQEETAEILRIPVGTVKSRTYYARRRLKEALEGS